MNGWFTNGWRAWVEGSKPKEEQAKKGEGGKK
jgi:hypothetical protein